MAEILNNRSPPPPPPVADRPLSLGSNPGSPKSSTFSAHYKVSSRSSFQPPSRNGSQRSSQSSSATRQNTVQRPAKRLKSQYPLDSAEPHVEYILVASFDIDRGPIMEHQYPGAISPDEHMLAELMLPDQTHMRQQDWTMFFLHKDNGNQEDEAAEKAARRQARRDRRAAREAAAQGAVVKAMAICTRHSFLHIYKPLLLLALEDYMKLPTPDTLELLYTALNSMDVSMMPRLSRTERHILQATDAKDMFVEKFEQMIAQRAEDVLTGRLPLPRVGSPSRSAAVPQYVVPRDTHELESKIVYNGTPIPVRVPTALSPETVGDFSLIKLIQTFGGPHQSQPQPFALHPHLTTSGAYTHPIIVLINAMLTQKRVIFLGHNRPSGEVAEAVLAACALASGGLLKGFTRHAFPYTDLTKIDELLKVPGFIAGVTNPTFAYHPEWWDLICDLPTGRIKISSSIEAAPITEGTAYFQQHHHSLLSNLQKSDHGGDATGDMLFMEDVNRSISSRHGEAIIRAKFRAYITKFTRVSAAFEETVYGASNLTVIPPTEVDKADGSTSNNTSSRTRAMSLSTLGRNVKGHGYVWPSDEAKARELAASAARIEGWRNTRSYYAFISDLANHTKAPPSPKSSATMADMLATKQYLDIYHSLSKLRTLRLSSAEAGAIYLALESYCSDYQSILELLELTPMSEAGLFHVALGLWHEDARVREAVTTLLDRIRNHPAGRLFVARIGGWANAGFARGLQEKEARVKSAHEDGTNLGFAYEMTFDKAVCESKQFQELALRGDIHIDIQPEPMPWIWRRGVEDDVSSSTWSPTTSSGATATSSASSTSSDISVTATSLPVPFDSSMGNNFTSGSCPAFFTTFVSNATFRSCSPVSLLLQNSVSFFNAERSDAVLSEILDIACASPLSVCAPLMTSLADQLMDDSHCGADFRSRQPLVLQAYNGLVAYEPIFKATCLKDGTENKNYCYADAITNTSNPAEVYPYYTALGLPLPATADPTCNTCLQQTMRIFADYAVDAAQPLSQTYISCADQLNQDCGTGFVDATIQAGSVDSGMGNKSAAMKGAAARSKEMPERFAFWIASLVVIVVVLMV
ncbi:hypothetical protein DV736_g4355, partial [Chaetothyriales sp. CBS 134916]